MVKLTSPAEARQLLADARAVIDESLEGALSLLHADRGDLQIVDPASGSLRIAAQAGLGDEYLEYFATVDDEGSACGRAARQLEQIVIADVNTDARFAPHREIAAASGFRAVHSTPLVGTRGRLVGVLSTHYRCPYRPPAGDLALMKRFGELIGQAVEASLEADGQAAFLRFRELAGQAGHRGEAAGNT